jgi:hypothetical protein
MNIMSTDKTTTTKRTAKKAVAASEKVKPAKSAAAPKAAFSKLAKTPAAGKAIPTKRPAKTVVADTEPTGKPRKTAAAPKAVSITAEKAVDEPSTAKAASKVRTARKTATSKPESVKKAAPAARKIVKKPAAPLGEERQRLIAIAAYYRAEARGFAPGHEKQDWLDAEAEIDALLSKA